MALLGTFGEDYTSTGHGMLQRWANKLSFIPIIGPLAATTIGYLDTAIESVQWLLKGKPLSAVTVAASGVVGNTINAGSGLIWWGNIGSGVTTGRSIGTHARKATEAVIGGLAGALGQKPMVLRSYTAGMGGIGAANIPSGPGRFSTQIANERGQNANDMYQAYQRGEGGAHINELGSAYQSR